MFRTWDGESGACFLGTSVTVSSFHVDGHLCVSKIDFMIFCTGTASRPANLITACLSISPLTCERGFLMDFILLVVCSTVGARSHCDGKSGGPIGSNSWDILLKNVAAFSAMAGSVSPGKILLTVHGMGASSVRSSLIAA